MCSNFFGILFSLPDLVVGCIVEAGATVSGGGVVWGRGG